MKLSAKSRIDSATPTEKWKCFDNCPVCRLLKRAAEKGKALKTKELEQAFAEAEAETETV